MSSFERGGGDVGKHRSINVKMGQTYQVCDLGNCVISPAFSMVNRLGPSLPWRSLKPLTGMRDVPVANCRRRDFCSESQVRMHWRAVSERGSRICDGGKRASYLPEVGNDFVGFGVTPVVRVLLPVFDVNVGDTADQQLELSLVEDADQILGDQLVEAVDEGVELLFDSLLNAPLGEKSSVRQPSCGGDPWSNPRVRTQRIRACFRW